MAHESRSTRTRSLCIYSRLDNGVHEFVMTEASRSAVDDFIDALEEMVTLVPPGKTAPILLDSVVGKQPTHYIFSRMLMMMRKYPPREENSRLAIMFKPSILINTIDVMMRLFPFLKVRFFKPDQRDEALQWLTEIKRYT